MSHSVGMWMPGAAFRVLQSSNPPSPPTLVQPIPFGIS
jgi:hypothetical protein